MADPVKEVFIKLVHFTMNQKIIIKPFTESGLMRYEIIDKTAKAVVG